MSCHDLFSARDGPEAFPIGVIELLQEFELPGNEILTIIGADLWTTWFEIRWLLRSDSDLYDNLVAQWWSADEQWRWRAEDDIGTEYQSLLGAGSGGNGRWSGSIQVFPQLDPTARTLRLRIPIPPQAELSTVEIDLHRGIERG